MYQIENLRFSYKLSHNQEGIAITIMWVILFFKALLLQPIIQYHNLYE
jgi:hypothetical protein